MRKRDFFKKRGIRLLLFGIFVLAAFFLGSLSVCAEENEDGTLPPEYSDFLDSIDGSVADRLPDGVFSEDAEEIEEAARELVNPVNILSLMLDSLGAGVHKALPSLALVLGIVILSAIISVFASSSGGMSRAVENCTRLCTFSAIAGMAVGCVESLSL